MKKSWPVLALIVAAAVWLGQEILKSIFKAIFISSLTIHVEHFIPAPPEAVWAVLVDVSAYDEWNRINPIRAGTYEMGHSIVTLTFMRFSKPLSKRTTVIRLIPDEEIVESGGSRSSLFYEHRWILKPVNGGTLLTRHEVFRGLKVSALDEEDFEPGYLDFMESLGERVVYLQSAVQSDNNPLEGKR